jgi:uncharacterized membrane protein YoaK (UPF0700 family)
MAGAFWDGFTYFGHGHVFANVMTANVVLFGVKVAAWDWSALRNLYPILAYLLGAMMAQLPRLPRVKEMIPDPALAALSAQILFCFCAGLYPDTFPDWPVVLGLSFFVAVQSSHFARVEKWPYASTMPTGNLRNLAESIFQALFQRPNPEMARRAKVFGIITLSFLAGAALGGLSVAHLHNKALWVPAILLLLVSLPILAEDRHSRHAIKGAVT